MPVMGLKSVTDPEEQQELAEALTPFVTKRCEFYYGSYGVSRCDREWAHDGFHAVHNEAGGVAWMWIGSEHERGHGPDESIRRAKGFPRDDTVRESLRNNWRGPRTVAD